MFYCPRCNREYNEGGQRFCIHDGGRLMPKTAARKSASGGVFTNLVGKASARDESDEILSLPNFVPVAKPDDKPTAPSFISDADAAKELFSDEKGAGKQITMSELPSFQAALGDRKTNPTGRLALTWENPNVLLGHVIRGRYFIEQRLNHDDICITYLAQDRAANGKKVIFKVLSLGSDFIQNSAEERVGLSHLNHPHIVKILDSGEMPEGMPFAVFEYVEGESLRELLDSGDPIAAGDTARIVKQVAEALSSAQQNGVFHYDVRPQKVILKPEADGTPIAKVTDFTLAKGYKPRSVRKLKDVAYQSPEQLQNREITTASESYSLAAIAYEMLTGRLPFSFTSMRELLDAQKRGLQSKPTMVLHNLPEAVDEIFTRALSFDLEKRYPKARDFGDALYGALNAAPARPETEPAVIPSDEILVLDDLTVPVVSPEPHIPMAASEEVLELPQPKAEPEPVPAPIQAAPDNAWEKRSIESEGMSKWAIATLCLLGALVIGAGIFVYINYFSGDSAAVATTEQQNAPAANQDPLAGDQNVVVPADTKTTADENPPPREITPPENSVRFQNTKDGLSPELLKNFRGFSLYYPQDWVKKSGDSNFLNISKSTESGTPVEQMLVYGYESKGLFSADDPGFPKLGAAINKKWSAQIPNFNAISQGVQTINGRQVYEVKFQGDGETKSGEKITIWGRTLFLPSGKPGMKNGLVVTMLATSHSPDVKSVDDVGNAGQLKDILYTLEPDPLDVGP